MAFLHLFSVFDRNESCYQFIKYVNFQKHQNHGGQLSWHSSSKDIGRVGYGIEKIQRWGGEERKQEGSAQNERGDGERDEEGEKWEDREREMGIEERENSRRERKVSKS